MIEQGIYIVRVLLVSGECVNSLRVDVDDKEFLHISPQGPQGGKMCPQSCMTAEYLQRLDLWWYRPGADPIQSLFEAMYRVWGEFSGALDGKELRYEALYVPFPISHSWAMRKFWAN